MYLESEMGRNDAMDGSPGTAGAKPDASPGAPIISRVQSICQRVWGAATRVIWEDAGGIDDSALPAGFAAPYRRGSRSVRSLWHIPF
jgi:hypothetical protein